MTEHYAEVFFDGLAGSRHWGWQCLTCGAEDYVADLRAAEEAADAHRSSP